MEKIRRERERVRGRAHALTRFRDGERDRERQGQREKGREREVSTIICESSILPQKALSKGSEQKSEWTDDHELSWTVF